MPDKTNSTDNTASLLESVKAVLAVNDQGTYTIPAEGLYPHQWLWDSCFIAIGLRHLDIERAKTEILSLLRGQWANGMIPHMIFSSDGAYRRDRNIWRSWLNPDAPDNIFTSGITQPPMVAEAIWQIGQKLDKPERRSWYAATLPALINYHAWLYRERDPHNEGLVLLVHPTECGLDNTPPWISQLREHSKPWWVDVIEKLKLDVILNLFRRDTKRIPPGQRISNIEALVYFDTIRRLRRKAYRTDDILPRSLFTIEDLSFNAILIRANDRLRSISKTLHQDLPEELLKSMKQAEAALEDLWDVYGSQYYSRNFVTHRLIKHPTIASLLPLYAGCISKDRAAQLVRELHNKHTFGSHFPVPTVPANSEWFKPLNYWQGPTWINTNWLIYQGLQRYGYQDEAEAVRNSCLQLVEQSGAFEYFSPLDGTPAGAHNFSWTAALVVDFLEA